MALAKPYTVVDAARQSEDIDRMLDELYRANIDSSTTSTAGVSTGSQGPAGSGAPGQDGEDGIDGIGAFNRTGNPLPVVEGGTSVSTFTTNGVLYGNATGAIQVTAQGSAISVLTANAGAPSFSATPTVGTLTVTGTISGASLTTTGAAVIGTTLTATGAISGASLSTTGTAVIGTTLTVTGAISGASLSTTGAAVIGNTLTVTGAISGNGTLTVASGEIIGAVVTATGNVNVGTFLDLSTGAAGQIKFPAVQNASTNVNTLDDYEEGTWTPVLTGTTSSTGATYTTQVGKYVKIGKLVQAQAYMVLSNKGTMTGGVQIGGLPFTSENTTNQFSPSIVTFWDVLTTAMVFVGGYVNPNDTKINIAGATGAATAIAGLGIGDLSNTTALMGTAIFSATA